MMLLYSVTTSVSSKDISRINVISKKKQSLLHNKNYGSDKSLADFSE